eukprot:scaffold1854_cov113-Isochrysis_galbana.AAC.4
MKLSAEATAMYRPSGDHLMSATRSRSSWGGCSATGARPSSWKSIHDPSARDVARLALPPAPMPTAISWPSGEYATERPGPGSAAMAFMVRLSRSQTRTVASSPAVANSWRVGPNEQVAAAVAAEGVGGCARTEPRLALGLHFGIGHERSPGQDGRARARVDPHFQIDHAHRLWRRAGRPLARAPRLDHAVVTRRDELALRFDRELDGVLVESVDVPRRAARVRCAQLVERHAHQVLLRPPAKDAFLGPDSRLALSQHRVARSRRLRVARGRRLGLDALLQPEEPDVLLAHRHHLVGDRVVVERVDLVVVPLLEPDPHLLQVPGGRRRVEPLVFAPPVDGDAPVVVFAHGRDVCAVRREGHADDGAPVVALDQAELLQLAGLVGPR